MRESREMEQPEVVHEYETHKSSVDAANNPRNNMPSYHDIISTERWEMRFSGFVLGICEANTFSAYRNFYANSSNMGHTTFRDTFVSIFKPCSSKGIQKQPYLRTD
ncbi:hypothetical protein V8B55DRAFT_1429993 [Mucor lusitanicus]